MDGGSSGMDRDSHTPDQFESTDTGAGAGIGSGSFGEGGPSPGLGAPNDAAGHGTGGSVVPLDASGVMPPSGVAGSTALTEEEVKAARAAALASRGRASELLSVKMGDDPGSVARKRLLGQ